MNRQSKLLILIVILLITFVILACGVSWGPGGSCWSTLERGCYEALMTAVL